MRRRVRKRLFTVLGLCAVLAAAPAGIVNAEGIGEGEDVRDIEYDL